MKSTALPRFWGRYSYVMCLCFACVAFSRPSSKPSHVVFDVRNPKSEKIEEIVKDPKNFDQKAVSFIALLHMDGEYLVLYQNDRDAASHDFAKSIYVETFADAPSYKELNNHWVKVMGIIRVPTKSEKIDASSFHPCKLTLVSIDPIKRPPFHETRVHLILRNETKMQLTFALSSDNGRLSTTEDLPSGASESFEFKNVRIVIRDKSGERLLDEYLDPAKALQEYFDPGQRSFYYRFSGKKLEPVRPEIGRRWPQK